jgi:hypothetical protein
MKHALKLLLIFWMIFQIGSSDFAASASQAAPGNIYFFRLPNYPGSAAKMTILANDKPVVRLRNRAYFRYEASPGDYIFSLSFGSSSKVSLTVEPGKDYFIKCYINMGFWSGIPIMELVDPVSGKSLIDGNALTEQTAEPVSIKPRYSRLGIIMSGGFGFETYPWFVDENGDDVKLSTGGGFGIGAEYGYQFSKNFDLSVNWFYQGSSLSKQLKNASGSFARMGITITPALVIPVKGGDVLRFRLGAGPGLYSLGTMKIDASEINGQKLNFKYNPAAGLHGLFMFESNLMERGAMELGIRVSSIRYKLNENKSTHTSSDEEILKPNGSGIDFIMGYNFRF